MKIRLRNIKYLSSGYSNESLLCTLKSNYKCKCYECGKLFTEDATKTVSKVYTHKGVDRVLCEECTKLYIKSGVGDIND